jgi:magnesium transporter
MKSLTSSELQDAWHILAGDERLEGFHQLPRTEADDFFLGLTSSDQAEILISLPEKEKRSLMRLLAPDDAADVIQEVSGKERYVLLDLIDSSARQEVMAILQYEEDSAGGIMTTQYLRVRPDMTVESAMHYIRRQSLIHVEHIRYLYVLDDTSHLLGVVSLRELLSAPSEKSVQEFMHPQVITILDSLHQVEVGALFSKHKFVAIPVVNAQNEMKGIVTLDDVMEVMQEEATKDIQKLGGSETLDAPYLQNSLFAMVKKRAVWLAILFVGEMFTATAMSHFEDEIEKAVVLALFIPLIISSGGNSGSQASTLIVRALALGEVRMRDWWRVFMREIASGLAMGTILGGIGFLRIALWPGRDKIYGPHYLLIGLTVGLSVIGVVMWGTISGAMIPFVLRKLRLDPATASAPFVATLVDVTGLIIYFSIASLLLRGVML